MKGMVKIGTVFGLSFFLLLTGCATMEIEWPEQEPNLIAVSYSIADALIERLKAKPVPFSPILVASFVETGKADRPSNLGRMMSDFIASRMSMNGLRVVGVRLGDQVRLVRDGGDLLASREGGDSADLQKAQAIVVGTYTKANRGIYVSTRILRADNQQIISSVDLHIPLSYEMMFLL
jgi:hypothetical protein